MTVKSEYTTVTPSITRDMPHTPDPVPHILVLLTVLIIHHFLRLDKCTIPASKRCLQITPVGFQAKEGAGIALHDSVKEYLHGVGIFSKLLTHQLYPFAKPCP